RRGLGFVGGLAPSPERDQQELELQLALGSCLAAIHGYSSGEVGAVYDRTNELCEALGDSERLFTSLNGQFLYCSVIGRTRDARQIAERMRWLADSREDPSKRVISHRAIAAPLMQLGELVGARAALEKVLTFYDPQRDRSLALQGAHDPRATEAARLTRVLWMLGYPNQAKTMQTQALGYAAERNHANTTAYVRHVAARLDLL